jgi:hypothetical protein
MVPRRETQKVWSEDERGGIGGRSTSEVFVKTTKVELFANYGTKFRFPGGCVICVDRLNRRLVYSES